MTIFLIFLACVLQSAMCLPAAPPARPASPKCDPNENKLVTLKVFVEHHQQSLTSAASYTKTITASSAYKKEYDSLDTSASVSGGGAGFSASASASYSKVNDQVSSSKNYANKEEGEKKTFNPKQLQISREVTTTVMIGGTTSEYYDKEFVNSTPLGKEWTPKQLEEASIEFLKRKYQGEDSKIHRTTYESSTCLPLKCGKKCMKKKKADLINNADLKNGSKECWWKCNKRQGNCSWCGTDGWCCRKGWRGNGCDGKIGGSGDHICVLRLGLA